MPPRKRQREATERDKAKGSTKTEIRYRARRVHPLEFRVRVVREIRERKVSVDEVARIFGVNRGTLYDWVKRYEEKGLEGLTPQTGGPRAKPRSGAAAAKREAVRKLREEHPEWGTRRISEVLRRFQALGVSGSLAFVFKSKNLPSGVINGLGLVQRDPFGDPTYTELLDTQKRSVGEVFHRIRVQGGEIFVERAS